VFVQAQMEQLSIIQNLQIYDNILIFNDNCYIYFFNIEKMKIFTEIKLDNNNYKYVFNGRILLIKSRLIDYYKYIIYDFCDTPIKKTNNYNKYIIAIVLCLILYFLKS